MWRAKNIAKGWLVVLSVWGVVQHAAFAEAPSEISASIVGFGEVVPNPEADSAQASQRDAGSHNGALFVMHPDMVPLFKKTANRSQIPLRVGLEFGMEVQLNGPRDGAIIPVRTRWSHPVFKDGVSVEEWASPMNVGYGRFAGWVVEDETEMAPGVWIVEILYEGKTIAKKEFHLTLEAQKEK